MARDYIIEDNAKDSNLDYRDSPAPSSFGSVDVLFSELSLPFVLFVTCSPLLRLPGRESRQSLKNDLILFLDYRNYSPV